VTLAPSTNDTQIDGEDDWERVMEPRDRIAIGRELLAIARTEARLQAEAEAALADIDEQRARLAPRKVLLEQLLEHFARQHPAGSAWKVAAEWEPRS
jgi:hypothetical protein